MKFIISGIIFWFLETWYFGWNWWIPSCEAERSCDEAAKMLVIIGFFQYILHEEAKWLLRILKQALKESNG